MNESRVLKFLYSNPSYDGYQIRLESIDNYYIHYCVGVNTFFFIPIRDFIEWDRDNKIDDLI